MGRILQIETFVKVIETGSLAAAARGLNVSSAAVSKQISKLESELGVQLLIRSTRRIDLTDMGRAYLSQCQRILEEVNEADALVSKMKQIPHGRLKIFSHRHFTRKFIVPNLPEFLSLYPEIEIDLDIGERIPNPHEEGIDVMIGLSALVSEDLIQKTIATTRYLICASPNYLKQFGVPKKPEDLLDHRCLAHSGRNPLNTFFLQKNAELGFKPFLNVNDIQSLEQMVQLGLGIGQFHHYVVRPSIDEGKLVPILEEDSRRDVPIYVAYPPRRFLPNKVRCFIDFIVHKVKEYLVS